jgi:hypothetical protein
MDIGCFTDVTAPFVAAYDEILKGSLATFLQLTSQIGGDLSKMVSILQLTNQIGGDLSKMVSILQLTNQIGGDLSKMVSIVLNITACTENILTN